MSDGFERPVMIFDGTCGFCRKWIVRWHESTGDRVEYLASQDRGERFPDVPQSAFDTSVQFIDERGARFERSEAVARCLAQNGAWWSRLLLVLLLRVPGLLMLADFAYKLVAANRGLSSCITTALWGDDVRRPTYATANSVFLRVLALIYLIAFVSFWIQAPGLIGDRGILPVGQYFPAVHDAIGADRWWRLPSLMWLAPTDSMVTGLCLAGCVLSVALLVGIAPVVCTLGLWACYLSLVGAGQVFYAFQWDMLLIEAGLLAIFLAPLTLRPRWNLGNPHWAARALTVWLLFRLMFSSALVKLTSGDPTWADRTALSYHFFTQPIPNGLAWWADHLPASLLSAMVGGMFFIGLVAPFLMWAPRRLRLLAALLLASLQMAIALTGNYGFFNFLSLALMLMLIDDLAWPGRKPARPLASRRRWSGWVIVPVGACLLLLSVIPFWSATRRPLPAFLDPLAHAYEWAAPFRSINGYGLFANMTTNRPEITVQGTLDGRTWETYIFRYKPGPLDRMPPQVAPYMPRLDWQMWFAALGRVEQNPWFVLFLRRLLEAEPEVLALLERDPFDGERPRQVRAYVDDYQFTSIDERRQSGNWWTSEPRAIYVPEIGVRDFR